MRTLLVVRIQVTRWARIFPLARTCTRQSRSSSCKNRASIFRDTRRWVSRPTISQSCLSPLVLSSFQKPGGYHFTGGGYRHWHDRYRSSELLIVFSSDSGYDFGYLVKLLTAVSLPTSEDVFFESLRTWFPHCYDIKFMMRACKSLKGGLQDVADDLGVRPISPPRSQKLIVDRLEQKVMRIGTSHQAGSDSLLTASTFFKMRELYFGDQVDDGEYNGKLYGLGQTFSVPNGFTDNVRGGATIAERDDRSVARDAQNATPASNGQQQTQNSVMGIGVPIQTPSLGGALPPSGTAYAPMGGSNNPFMRPAIGVGR